MSDIAIIGYSARFPGARNTSEFWENLCQGKESVRFFTAQELIHHGIPKEIVELPNYVRASPVLDNIDMFDSEFFSYNPGHANVLDPQHRFMLECAWEAWELAGYATTIKAQKTGCFVGSGGIVTSYLSEYFLVNAALRGMTGCVEHLANDKDFIPTRVSYNLNLTGPSMAVQTACSTSLLAVHQACRSLLNGECEMAFAGAVNIRVPHEAGYIRQRGDIYSEDGHTRAFDANATGIVFGSGCGVVLLKPLAKAIADGDTIYAVIKGSAINNDGGEKLSYTASSYEGQIECIDEAFKVAGVSPDSLRYVEAHGTGTVMGDPVEVSALTKIFQSSSTRKQSCGLGSVKSNVGHLDTAAGMAGLIKAIMILNHKKIPPQINITKLNPKIDFANSPFYVNTKLEELQAGENPLRIGINSLGIGGTNAFLILEEAPKIKREAKKSSPLPLLLNLSARSKEGLKKHAADFRQVIEKASDEEIGDICYTSNTGRGQFEHRISLLADSASELKKHIKGCESGAVELSTGYELNVAFHMDDLSDKAAALLRSVLKDMCVDCAHPFHLNAAHLSMWINYGIRPKAINVSLRQLPVAAFVLGYLTVDAALEIYQAAVDNKFDVYLNGLKKHLHLRPYKTELKLLPQGIDLIDLRGLESWDELQGVQQAPFDVYCKDEEITELLVLDTFLNFSCLLERTPALPEVESQFKTHVLKQLHRYYKMGGWIDWSGWYEGGGRRKVALPTYPFQRKHHWIPRTRRLHLQDSVFCWNTREIKVPTLQDDVYEISLSLPEYPVLHDHYFCDRAMVAGSALMSWITEIASEHYQIHAAKIEDFSFSQALMVPDEGSIDVQLVVVESDSDRYKFVVRSYRSDFLLKKEMWVEHASGYFTGVAKNIPATAVQDAAFGSGVTELSASEIYSRLDMRGLQLTTAYRCLQSLKKTGQEALARLDIQHLHSSAFYGKYHPGIVDALFQVVQCLLPNDVPATRVFLLSQWQAMSFYKECQSPRYIYAKMVDRQGGQQFTADVQLLNDQKEVIASVERVIIQRGSREIAQAMEMAHYQQWQYSLDWKQMGQDATKFAQLKGNVVVYADDIGVAKSLKPLLESADAKIHLVSYAEFANPIAEPVNAAIYLWPIDSQRALSPAEVKLEVEKTCASLLSIAKKYFDTSVPIYIITQGGIGAQGKESHINPLQGSLWGMGRTLSVERGKGSCYLIDLDPDQSAISQIEALSRLLLNHPKEEQIALRGRETLVPRLSHYQKPSTKRLGIEFVKPYEVTFKPDAMPLPWQVAEGTGKEPKSDEVLVRLTHSGLAYRDYLQATGVLGNQGGHIGDDFVGIVEACGSGVTDLKKGDQVLGLHSGALASHLTVNRTRVVAIPSEVKPRQSAAWPLNYVTAAYGLEHLANLKEGDVIVIPSASSGVGHAAVQIAKRRKAKIIATAKGSEKVFLMTSQGLTDVVDTSRDGWQEKLEGLIAQGAVNCILAGTHMEITEVAAKRLTANGTIIDLSGGKHAYSEAIKQHAGYHPVHMYDVIEKQPDFIQRCLTQLADLLKADSLHPMATQEYSIVQLPEAIAQLGNSNHLKKLIISHADVDDVLFKSNATYVVVGGLGALGRVLIPWLIENGVKSLCIIDIVEQDPALKELLRSKYGQEFLNQFDEKFGKNFLFDVKKKYGKDVLINYYRSDVNNEESVREVVGLISKEMPPIKGILHCATMLYDAPIPKQTMENFYKILSVKTTGSINLHLNTLLCDLDYFVMFSSIASLMGSPNQFNYSAANSFQDALSHHRHKIGLPTMAINWSPWKVGVGAYMGESAQKVWESWGSYMLDPAKDLNSLRYLLKLPIPQVALFAIDWKKFTGQFEKVPGYLAALAEEAKKADTAAPKENLFLAQFAGLSEPEAREKLNNLLKEEIASCLQLEKEKIEPDLNFSNLGIDSLMSISVRDHLQKKIGKELPATIMFNYPTLQGLSGFVLDNFIVLDSVGVEKKAQEAVEEMSDKDIAGFLDKIDLDK